MSHRTTWRRHRKISRRFWLTFLAYVPFHAALFKVIQLLEIPRAAIGPIVTTSALCWMGLLLYLSYRLATWPCPSCGQHFHFRSVAFWDLTRKRCANCSYLKNSDREASTLNRSSSTSATSSKPKFTLNPLKLSTTLALLAILASIGLLESRGIQDSQRPGTLALLAIVLFLLALLPRSPLREISLKPGIDDHEANLVIAAIAFSIGAPLLIEILTQSH